jgi:multiple antibiotic resistance protein
MAIDPQAISVFTMNFSKFFSMFNVLGTLPIFMGLTAKLPAPVVRRMALLVAITPLIGTYIFIGLGTSILEFFDISLEAFRIAGGIVVAMAGYQMLTGSLGGSNNADGDSQDPNCPKMHKKSLLFAITPLGIPLVFGPGCISLVISAAGDNLDTMGNIVWPERIALMLALAAVSLTLFLVLVFGRYVRKLLGDQGMTIILKVMGLILMVMAIQMAIRGTTDIVKDVFKLDTIPAEQLNLNA